MSPQPIPALTSRAVLAALVLACAGAAGAQGFKFSNQENAAAKDEAERAARVGALLSTPCRDRIKNRKILVLIGEERNGVVQAKQAAFSPHFEAVNQRLRSLGLRTATAEEIRRQVAQAEIDAYFKNDPDAALSAARRLAANYTLKGLISSSATVNPVLKINQVAVGMHFMLTGANGRKVSEVQTRDQSYAGADAAGMALTLINEQAEEVVARLYSDYCQQDPARK
ncbi:MAG: hypothetical protein JNM90_24870 [Burkholderiales bacterium]|nr:hypothetical protein [Burkholderiales bacterium]